MSDWIFCAYGAEMAADKVTKYELVDSIYREMKCDRATIHSVVDKFLDGLKASLSCGSTIELRGFGTFEPRLRKGRDNAHNPKTGEICSMPPHYVAAFRAGRELKQALYGLEIKDE